MPNGSAVVHIAGVHYRTDTGHHPAAEQADDCGVGGGIDPGALAFVHNGFVCEGTDTQGGSQRGPVGEGHGL